MWTRFNVKIEEDIWKEVILTIVVGKEILNLGRRKWLQVTDKRPPSSEPL